LDLKDVTLVDRDAIKYLADCEADGTKLANCPAYVREWIGRERGRPMRKKQDARIDKPQKKEQRNELE
jgi:predicted metal-binding protein